MDEACDEYEAVKSDEGWEEEEGWDIVGEERSSNVEVEVVEEENEGELSVEWRS